jgi:hypothetical protein
MKESRDGYRRKNSQSGRRAHERGLRDHVCLHRLAGLRRLAAILEPICVVGILPLHDRMWKLIEARLAARRVGGSAPAGT